MISFRLEKPKYSVCIVGASVLSLRSVSPKRKTKIKKKNFPDGSVIVCHIDINRIHLHFQPHSMWLTIIIIYRSIWQQRRRRHQCESIFFTVINRASFSNSARCCRNHHEYEIVVLLRCSPHSLHHLCILTWEEHGRDVKLKCSSKVFSSLPTPPSSHFPHIFIFADNNNNNISICGHFSLVPLAAVPHVFIRHACLTTPAAHSHIMSRPVSRLMYTLYAFVAQNNIDDLPHFAPILFDA